jgi:hypothetical protein
MSRDGPNDGPSVTPPISEDGNPSKSRSGDSGQSQGSSSKESPLSDESGDSTAQDLTYLKISNDGRSSYRGYTHWEAILDSVKQIVYLFEFVLTCLRSLNCGKI